MENIKSVTKLTGVFSRIKFLLKLDFYRLFHTPVFYIMIAVAAIIPAMILAMTVMETGAEGTAMFTNTWQLIASASPTYLVSDIGEYANINMIYIFGGILLSVFIGHDYMSGFVKNVFTVHSKKADYAISKTAIGAFSMTCMIGTYFIGTVIAGLITSKSFNVDAGGLISCLISKIIMSLGFSALFTTVNVLFRRLVGLSVCGAFFFGTGMLIMAAAAMIPAGGHAALNIFLYGSACFASLSSGFLTIVICFACSLAWAVIYTLLSAFVLKKRDLV